MLHLVTFSKNSEYFLLFCGFGGGYFASFEASDAIYKATKVGSYISEIPKILSLRARKNGLQNLRMSDLNSASWRARGVDNRTYRTFCQRISSRGLMDAEKSN